MRVPQSVAQGFDFEKRTCGAQDKVVGSDGTMLPGPCPVAYLSSLNLSPKP